MERKRNNQTQKPSTPSSAGFRWLSLRLLHADIALSSHHYIKLFPPLQRRYPESLSAFISFGKRPHPLQGV